MKSFLLLSFVLCAGFVATAGCTGRPQQATEQEAKQSMDATMNMQMNANPNQPGKLSGQAPAGETKP